MRSTLEIDDMLLEEALQLTNARTKKEVVNLALETLVRLKQRDNLRKKLGRFPLELSLGELEKLREES